MREYYDLWDTFSGRLSARGRLKEQVRRTLIRRADTYLLKRRGMRVVAQSATVCDRLARWNGIQAEVLHPPAPPRPYRCDGYGDSLLFTSRLAPLKRADLVLRALAEPAAAGVRCVLAGEGEERDRLQAMAAELRLGDRVTFPGYLSDAALVDHLARCRAVVFVPLAEDYGFVTVEAFSSAKAVITCTDSGGPAELVRSGENGLVLPPDPAALAAAMADLMRSPARAEALGRAAKADADRMTWEGVVRRLVIVQGGRGMLPETRHL
jgi:glycosyltransferase involved in cell wall biosynthesis